MDNAFTHLFADHDARLDGVLSTLRREQREAEGSTARTLVTKAVREIERHRGRSLGRTTFEQFLEEAIAASPYEQLMRAVRLAKQRLNPIAEALQAEFHAAEDRRVVRHLLALHRTHAAKIASKWAVLLWLTALSILRQRLARVAARFPIRRANGFFGADKVDGRNIP